MRYVRRDRTEKENPVKWNGEVFDAKPLCAQMEQFRKNRPISPLAGAKETSRRRNVLKLMEKTVSQFLYFRHLRENTSESDT